MKTKSILSLALTGLLIVACGQQEEKKIISVEKKAGYEKMVPVHANRKLAIEIDGMSCVHACGGSIRMALKETGAVDRVSYDFETGRKTNTAFITFDKSKISADKIISIIETINDKQFTTGKSTSSDLESKDEAVVEGSATSETTSGQKASVSMESVETSSFKMRNIYELFASLIH